MSTTITDDQVQTELRFLEGQIRSMETVNRGSVSTLNMASGTILCLNRLGLIDHDQKNELLQRVQGAFAQE